MKNRACFGVRGLVWPCAALSGLVWPCLALRHNQYKSHEANDVRMILLTSSYEKSCLFRRARPCLALRGLVWPCLALSGLVWPCLALLRLSGLVSACAALRALVWPCLALSRPCRPALHETSHNHGVVCRGRPPSSRRCRIHLIQSNSAMKHPPWHLLMTMTRMRAWRRQGPKP